MTLPLWRAQRPWLRRDIDKLPSRAQLRKRGANIRARLLPWFEIHGRTFPWRTQGTGWYEHVICEVLLQQTSARAVAGIYPDFVERFPSWTSLACATETEISSSLKPLGLWRRRSATLPRLAAAMVNMGGKFSRDRQALEQLPGVGQYIASAVMLFVHGDPEPLLDVNMARVIERYFGFRTSADIRHDRFLQAAARACVEGQRPQEVNWAFLDLGALICKSRKPACDRCPLKRGCYYRAQLRLSTSPSNNCDV